VLDATIDSYPVARGAGRDTALAVRARDRLIARWRSSALDRGLAAGAPPDGSGALLVRARALLEPGTRRAFGRSLLRIAGQSWRAPSIGGRVPVHRDAVADARGDLELLARRLLGDGPVAVRGVAQASMLLTDGSGPIFWRRSDEVLRERVRDVIEALDTNTPDEPAVAGGEDGVR
jgi:hypothetical protein